MALPDYYDLIEPLELPIRGKKYRIPPASAADVARWKLFADRMLAGEDIPDDEKIDDAGFYRIFLGSALDEMRQDGVLPEVVLHAARVAVAESQGGRAAAESVWVNPGPKAPTQPQPPASEDSTPTPKASPRSRSTAAESKTRSRASSSTTKSRAK